MYIVVVLYSCSFIFYSLIMLTINYIEKILLGNQQNSVLVKPSNTCNKPPE